MTVVNTNIGALQAQASMSSNQKDLERSLERLSSGLRINSAADDAAGMAIANKLDAQIKGLNQAIRNANDGKALIDTAEGAQVEVNNLLQRLRELAVQSSNDTNSAVDRLYIEKEADQILNEINRIGDQTRWNGMRLLDGTFDNAQFQVGHKQNEDIDLAIRSVKAASIGTNRIEGVATHIAGNADSIDAHNITIAGHIGSQTVAIAANASAKTAASNINQKSELTGVTANAVTKAEISKVHATGNVGFTIGTGTTTSGTSQDAAVITTTNVSDISDLTVLRDAINDKSGITGITAALRNDDKSRIVLTHATGEDIMITSVTANNMTVRSLDSTGAETNARSSDDTESMLVIGSRAADTDNIVANAQSAANGTLTVIDVGHVGGKVKLTSAGNDSGKSVTITGTDLDGAALSETIAALGSGGAVTSTKFFATVSTIVASGQTAAAIKVGFLAADSTHATFVGNVQFDSVRSFSATASAGSAETDNFLDGGTTTDSSSFLNVGDVDLGTVANSEKAIAIIDGALSMIDLSRAEQGAISNRLDHAVSNLTNVVVNTEASKSHILDANFAKESSNLTKSQILAQAATSMLAQANASKQTVLALLQN